ncbi:ABC transporter ATP-binding protein [Phaeacidiphilus oryzae]|uniref:ABC transporter ATP-binding protein n=1 Tax=Phaeacidiphilus oryzae TaxID=348818 RepID=UPI000A03F61A|nr:ABC transporter ATP-binding protein [Phaeacidiphilus oryzae]
MPDAPRTRSAGPAAGEAPAAGPDSAPLLETRGLSRHFKVGAGYSRSTLHAVDDVDLVIGRAEIVALVGESGSGKSTIARLLAQVYRPTSGEIRYQGRSLAGLRGRRAQLRYRGDVPMVFQDPFSSLNPVYRVSHGILRGLRLHRPELSRAERQAEAERVVAAVGLTPAGEVLGRYPYELSGGQRQRIGFAQALAYRPTLILADEPVSMLDVSIRIGLLNVMARLRAAEGVSFLYITHDIASARYVSDRLLVMYGGHIVESGPTEAVLAEPRHPYTRLLLSAVPDPRAPLDVGTAAAQAEPAAVIDPAPGCRFRARCPLAVDACDRVTPRLRELGPAHSAACHVAEAD